MRNSRITDYERQSTGENAGNTGGKLFAVLILIAVIIYLVASMGAGSLISKKILNPVIDFFKPKPTATASTKTSEHTSADSVETISEISSHTKTLYISSDEIYLLQTASFTDSASADTSAKELSKKGGAGYILKSNAEDKENFGVIIAGYGTKDDAVNVAERLTEMDIEIKQIQSEALSFDVSADNETTDFMENIIKEIEALPYFFYEKAVAFDKGNSDFDETVNELKDIQSKINRYSSIMRTWNETNNASVDSIYEFLISADDEISSLIASKDSISLSSGLKYSYISLFLKKAMLIEELSGI